MAKLTLIHPHINYYQKPPYGGPESPNKFHMVLIKKSRFLNLIYLIYKSIALKITGKIPITWDNCDTGLTSGYQPRFCT